MNLTTDLLEQTEEHSEMGSFALLDLILSIFFLGCSLEKEMASFYARFGPFPRCLGDEMPILALTWIKEVNLFPLHTALSFSHV